MNKTQRKKLTQARRAQMESQRLEKRRQAEEDSALAEMEAEQEGEELLEAERTEEIVEKDLGEEAYYAPGATSWDELDAERSMQEQAQEVRETTWDVQDLVRNILNHPELSAQEKSAAIQEVGNGFGERVDSIMSDDMTQKELDLDLLSVEAILAYDKRHTSALEKATGWITKKKLSYAAEQALSDSDFALVVTRDGKKVRKYPVHDAAHTRNALARAAQQIKAGGQGASDAKAALPKIRAAAKKFGIEVSTEKERNAILVEKDKNGDWRWVGWVSNNFQDWDGDIISKHAHQEFVDWLDKNKDMAPAFLSWHTPGTKRESPADFWDYRDGFLIMSGKLTEKEAAGLLRAKALTDLGMSHGTWVMERDPNDPRVIAKYRMYETSDLPLEKAANPFTDFEILVKEVDMDKTEYLAALIGKEQAELFLKKTGLKKNALEEAGVASKEKPEETPEAEPAPEPPASLTMEEVVERVKKEMDLEGLAVAFQAMQEALDKVPVLEGLVKELSKDRDEKLAEVLTPPASRLPWAQKARASQSAETVVKSDEDKVLAAKKPGVPDGYWLSEVTGTAPVPSAD